MDIDFDKEWQEFSSRMLKPMFDNPNDLEALKQKLMDRLLDTYFMDKLHSDYKDLLDKYRSLEIIEAENKELKQFIEDLLQDYSISHIPYHTENPLLALYIFNLHNLNGFRNYMTSKDSLTYKILKEKEDKDEQDNQE